MKFLKYIFFLFLIYGTVNAQQKKVLVELFTNSHCPLCPPAHNALSAYMENGLYKADVTYIFYHMVFPYSDDPLNNANPDDSNARNLFYGPYYATPVGFFDGKVQNSSYSSWASGIDAEAVTSSPFELTLAGTSDGNTANIKATIKQTSPFGSSDLVVNFVAVENIFYEGRNGISDHKFVMRKMFPSPDGTSFTSSSGQTSEVDESVEINNAWNTGKLGFVVFIQDRTTKTVYQSGFIAYNSLTATGVETPEDDLPLSFNLFQNYPNPFNPSTTIKFAIPSVGDANFASPTSVSLKIYDVIGREISTLVNGQLQPGSYEVKFDGSGLSSGLYFYTLRTKGFVLTRMMLLLK